MGTDTGCNGTCEFVCLSMLYVSVFVKVHQLLWFSGLRLNWAFLVVSTCVQFKQGAKLSHEYFFFFLSFTLACMANLAKVMFRSVILLMAAGFFLFQPECFRAAGRATHIRELTECFERPQLLYHLIALSGLPQCLFSVCANFLFEGQKGVFFSPCVCVCLWEKTINRLLWRCCNQMVYKGDNPF